MYSINNVTFNPISDSKVEIITSESKWTLTVEKAREFYRAQQILLKYPLENGVEVDDTNACPQHNLPISKEYSFGREDAFVFKYKCGCCVATDNWTHKYYRSYREASGEASILKAKASVW